MSKIGWYCRVGNREQLELTKEEQLEAMQRIAEQSNHSVKPNTNPIPSPEELKGKGYEVLTLEDCK